VTTCSEIYACLFDLLIKLILVYGLLSGGRVPYVSTPSVGVRVGTPATKVAVNVAGAVRSIGPLVAVAGVVVRLAGGVSVLIVVTVVGDASTSGGVAVSNTGTRVGVGEG
jgi:hypothetical protein